MSNTKITGLFYIEGSIDRPSSYNDNLKYGFDQSGGDPVFNYSINNMIDFFDNPIRLQRVISTGPGINTILTGIDDDNNAYNDLIDDSYDFDEIFKILSYLYNNQDTIRDMADVPYSNDPNDSNYMKNIADAYLSENFNDYSLHSIDISNSSINLSRVGKISFGYEINSELYVFTFYFVPDDLLLEYGLTKDKTTVFENDNPHVNINELEAEGIDKLLNEIEVPHNYTSYVAYSTTFVTTDINDMPDGSYTRYFYLFTHFHGEYEFDMTRVKPLIKGYLFIKHNGDNDYLALHYPDLFTNATIDIYPMVGNTYRGYLVTPISINNIEDILDSYNIPSDPEVRNSIEFFPLEGLGDGDFTYNTPNLEQGFFRIPLFAIEFDGISENLPISGKFPKYKIRHTGASIVDDDWETFHQYLKIAIKLAMGILDFNNFTSAPLYEMLNLDESTEFSYTLKTDNYGVDYVDTVSFHFKVTNYIVHSYNRG